MLNTKHITGALLASLLLAGCGGGGDSKSEPDPVKPVNQKPTVSITADTEANEQTAFTLSATAADSDGTIASYKWTTDASFDFTQTAGLSSNEATFTTPDINDDVTVNFTVTVTDDAGASSSATQEVKFKRNVSNVTITGLVTDNPIANAELEINVGDDVFQVTADANGRYTIEIVVDESSTDKLVLVKAKGLDSTDPGVVFVSQLSTIQSLLEQAGDDNTVDADDNFGVNITNVTTAEYALLTRDGSEPKSIDELNAALLNVDADEKINLAALIKIIVDYTDYTLPEGVANTLDLVKDPQIAQEFEDSVNETDPELIDKTKDEIKSDSDLVSDSDEPIVGDFIVNSPRYHNNSAYHLTLSEDGTGVLNINTSTKVTLSKEDSTYSLALEEDVITSKQSIFNGESTYHLTTYLKELSFLVLAENDVFRTIEVTEVKQKSQDFLDGGEPTLWEPETRTYTTNLIDKSQTIALEAAELISNVWVIDTFDNDFDATTGQDDPETLRFYEDGTGDVNYNPGDTFNWSLNDTKLSVTYDEDGETGIIEIWFTKTLSAGYQLVALDTSFEETSNTLMGLMIKKSDVTTTNEDIIGRWHGFIGTQQSYDLNIFPDGTVRLGIGDTGFQGYLEDGQFSRRRYYSEQYGIVSSCEGFDSSCYLEGEMLHDFITIVDNHYYIERTVKRYYSNGETFQDEKSIVIYEYSSELTYTDFTEELLDNYPVLYKDDGTKVSIYTRFNSDNTLSYVVSVDGAEYTASFNDGVISYEVNGTTWFMELVSADESNIIICQYKAGESCNESTQVSYLPSRPKVTQTVLESDNGSLSPMTVETYWYQRTSFEIIPDEGYTLGTISGCDGYVDGDYYIAYADSEDCEITATFVEQGISAGTYYITNSDYFHSQTSQVTFREDGTGDFLGLGESSFTWFENGNGTVEVTLDSEVYFSSYTDYNSDENGNPTTTEVVEMITGFNLSRDIETGTNWYSIERKLSEYVDDVFTNTYSRTSQTQIIDAATRLDITAEQVVGDWAMTARINDIVIHFKLNADGSGEISDAQDETATSPVTWSISDNTLTISQGSGDSIHLHWLKDIDAGYQAAYTFSESGVKALEQSIMIRRNVEPITVDNFAGHHQILPGYDLPAWSEVQFYDDGDVFYTFYADNGYGHFEDNQFVIRSYYDDTLGYYAPTRFCDVSLETCHLDREMTYTLINVDEDKNRYFIEREWVSYDYDTGDVTRTQSYIFAHEFSRDFSAGQFYDYNMHFYVYKTAEDDIQKWQLTYGDIDSESGKQLYSLTIDTNPEISVELVDGKLELILDGQDTVIEFVDNNKSNITFCIYLKGNSCQPEDEVAFSLLAPTHTLSFTDDGHGRILIGDNREFAHGSSTWLYIEADQGYELDEATGCDGYVEGDYYKIDFIKESCTVHVTFKEIVPLSVQTGITDSALASCVDNHYYSNIEEATYISCQWGGYGDITSLEGLENLTNLETLRLDSLSMGTSLDLTDFSELTHFTLDFNYGSEAQQQVESVTFFDPSKLVTLELENQNISTFDLSAFTSLETLSFYGNPLTQIDLSAQTKLTTLNLYQTNLSSIDLSANNLIRALSISNGSITSLYINHLTDLYYANLWNLTGVTELETSNLTNLEYLDIGFMGIDAFDFSNKSKLTNLGLAGTNITYLDFSNLPNLNQISVTDYSADAIPWEWLRNIESLEMGGEGYENFDFSEFSNLTRLYIYSSKLSSIATLPNPGQIEELILSQINTLTELDLSEFSALRFLALTWNSIESLDLSGNSELSYIDIYNNGTSDITGIESILDKNANIYLYENPWSDASVTYFEDLKANHGFTNLNYSLNTYSSNSEPQRGYTTKAGYRHKTGGVTLSHH